MYERRIPVLFFLSFALTSHVHANLIKPGAVPTPPPPKPPATAPTSFTETYSFTPPGGKTATNFTVTVTPGMSASDKADAIEAAITSPPIKASASRTSNTITPTIDVAGTIKLVTSTSTEKDTLAALGPAGPASFVTIAFGGVLTGTTYGNGGIAIYDAAFGFDGLLTQSSFSYDVLLTKTADGLLTATYNNLLAGLPSPLQGSLHLDLSTETIRFDLPILANNPFVLGDSSDRGLFYAESLVTPIPEPSGLSLVGIGAFWAIASGLRRRRTFGLPALYRAPVAPLPEAIGE